MEAFFGRLKVELVYAENYKTVNEAYTGIFEFIELFYNPVRRHSALGYMSPNEFEAKYAVISNRSSGLKSHPSSLFNN